MRLVIEACVTSEDTIELFVITTYLQQSFTSASSYSKTIHSSKSFKKQLEHLKISASVSVSGSVGIKLFSASASLSASASYDKLVDSVESSEKYEYEEKSNSQTFNPDLLQIIRKTVTRVTINGVAAQSTEMEFEDSVTLDQRLSRSEKRKWAEEYMEYLFGNGTTVKNTFTETACLKKGKAMTLLDPFFNSGDGISLKANNGKYLSSTWIEGNHYNFEARATDKSSHTKMFIEKLSENEVRLTSAQHNKYIGVMENDYYDDVISPCNQECCNKSKGWILKDCRKKKCQSAKNKFKITNLEVLMNQGNNCGNDCTFYAYEKDGKLVLKSKTNNQFLTHVYRYYDIQCYNEHFKQNIEASGYDMTAETLFTVESGV